MPLDIGNNKWFVIINPVAGGGKAPKLWRKLKPLLEKTGIDFEFAETKYINHACELAQAALQANGKNLLIIGGDGTANEVINGIVDYASDFSDITIAMFSVGTGNDWVRTIGKPASIQNIPRNLKAYQTKEHDVGLINYTQNALIKMRCFINIAGLGFDGHVAYKLSNGNSFLAGTKFRYWIGILQSLFSYSHTHIIADIDGVKVQTKTLSIAVGICKYNGGGMMQLPYAEINDGKLDMTIIGSMSKAKMVFSLPRLRNGSFTRMKVVSLFKGQKISVQSDIPIHVEADGEYLGNTPVEITILPQKINVLVWK